MSKEIKTRMGDGELITMSVDELREEIYQGSKDAAERGKIPELSQEDQDKVFEIMADPHRIVSVEPGEEVVVIDNLDKGHIQSVDSRAKVYDGDIRIIDMVPTITTL